MKSTRLPLLLATILLVATSVLGQTQPNLENGYKAYGSYDGSNIDTINTMNGNLMLHLPMPFSYPQRGGKLNLVNLLTVSSKNWSVKCSLPEISAPIGCGWTLGPGGAAALMAEAGSGLGFDHTMDLSVHRETTTVTDTYGVSYDAHAYSLSTADGAKHSLFASPSAAQDSNGDPLSYDAGDLSGYHLDLTGGNSATGISGGGVLTDRNGNRYQIGFFGSCSRPATNNNNNGSTSTITCTQASRTSTITDVNGNVLTLLGSAAQSDTMGRPFTTFAGTTSTTDFSGCVSNTWPLASATVNNYAGFNFTGNVAPNQFKLCYANVNIQTAFGAMAPAGPNGSLIPVIEAKMVAPQPMLVTVVMPDGTSWKFDYDSYGNVTHLGLPLGGSIDYTWQTIAAPSCGSNTTVSRAVATRTISDNNGPTSMWQYNYGAAANGVMTNTVTDPLGNDTVHVFTALLASCSLYYETSTNEYQGTGSSRQLIKQVDTSYLNKLGGEAFFIFANSYKTTVYPSGKVKLVLRTPDPGSGDPTQPTFGLVSQELEYDWGQGAPGPLLRETDTVYQWQKDSRYLTARLLDLPASVVVVDPNSANNTKTICPADGAGTTKACAAETDYDYDEAGYLQNYEAAYGILPAGTHVVAPNAVRGNLTSVGKWLNTSGTMIVSHTNWFDTGMVFQSIDPLNHASTQSYDIYYAGAFPTKTCDALNHCVSGTYDFTTGLLTSFTNQNGIFTASGNTAGDAPHTTTYGYDSFSRITLASFPDGGRVSFNYSGPGVLPAYMEKLKKITSSLPDDDSFAYLDGLGRPFKGVHKTPAGDVTVMTTYDALDRAIQVTNPYVSTSDPTYGLIKTQYDALGRTTQVTEQDGSFTTALYDQNGTASTGDCTASKDEAGKMRRTCSDGLGRTLEVDEPGDPFGGSKASGTLNVGGTLLTQSGVGAVGATSAAAAITISGSDNVLAGGKPVKCPRGTICDGTGNPPYYDNGKVFITVNGHEYDYFFGSGGNAADTAGSVAQGLANAIQVDGARVVNASIPPGTTKVVLTAKNAGSAGNGIRFTTGYTWDRTTFVNSSFKTDIPSGNLAGGTDSNPGTTVTDSGTTKATITNQSGAIIFTSAAVPYGGTSSNTTAAQVASALATALNVSGSPLSASASGSLTFNTLGAAGNVTVTVTSSSSQPAYFPNGSFSGSTALTNGSDPQAPSLDHPYVTLYSYDALSNLNCVVQKGMDTAPFTTCSAAPAAWRPRSFTYDSLSRLLTATNPESGTISYEYDNAGNILQKTSPAANQTGTATTTISICYDAVNRPTGKAYSAQTCQNGQLSAGTAVVSYTYDVGSNTIGNLSGVADQSGSSSYSYDALGRMMAEQRTISGVTKQVSYDYNLDGSVSAIHYPSGAAVAYTPDSAGRILSVTDSVNGVNYVTGARYAPNNSVTGFVNSSSAAFAGITNAFSYNQRLQPVNISAVTPSQQQVFSIGYDFHVGNGVSGSDNGNVYGVTNGKDASRGRTFTYDALNRLASAQTNGTDCSVALPDGHTKNWGDSYSYDPWGNLLAKTATKCGAENVVGTMNVKNQASSYSFGGSQPVNYIFDAAGNLINDGVFTYNYDAENRITGANGYTYTYDASGNRVKKSNGTTGTLYWYASVGVIAETDLAGNNPKEYVFFNGTRIARKDSTGQVFYYFSDHLKTASVITDATGNIKSESDYDPWGVERRVVDSFNNTYKFTGKERDGETGLDYFGARYYGSNPGRFMTPDWAAKAVGVPYANYGNPQSLNLYSYVQNNPTTLADPDGHAEEKKDETKVKPQKSGANQVKPAPRVNVGPAGSPVWQQRSDPGPAGDSNQGGSNQGGSNQGGSNQGGSSQGDSKDPIIVNIVNPITNEDQNGRCYEPVKPREVEQTCDATGCWNVYKDNGEALPHQNRMPTGEPLENAGDQWAHAAWIRYHEGYPDEPPHTEQEQRVPLPETWRQMPKVWESEAWKTPSR